MLADVCFGAVIGVAAACVCKKRVAYDSRVAELVASSAAVQRIVNLHRDSTVLLFRELRVCILTRRDLRIVGLLHFLCVCWVPLAARGATVPAASCLK